MLLTRLLPFAALLITGQCQMGDVPDNEDYAMQKTTPDAPKPKVLMGCYQETARGRSLGTYAPLNQAQMSPQRCETHCKQYNSQMFGVSRTWCFCGDTLGTGTKGAPLSQCNIPCAGDSEEFCGATLRVNIYGPEELLTEPLVPSTAKPAGCWQEPTGANRKALNDYPSLSNAGMTVQMCQDHCSAYQAHLFGVENGRECYCGMTTKNNPTRKPNTACNRPCVGNDGKFCGATNHFNLYELDFSQYKSIGQWGDLIQFPVIPVAIALMPESGNLLAWSAGWANRWTFAGNGRTHSAIYDAKSKTVSEQIVTNTQHDMFCPGITMNSNGKIIVTGGSTHQKTSIFDTIGNTWSRAADMAIPRAYQSSTLTSDGLVFSIGGDFRGAGAKNGEVYNPVNNTARALPGAPVAPMLMATGRGSFRADSHAWLFGWKDGSVFQAGPSRAMNWYGTRGTGSYKGVGNRGSDPDSMCGVFVMYDATQGKILTLGGSPTYDGSPSTSSAHIITIGEPNQPVNVERIQDGAYRRGYANGVVLPDGKVFIVGGQTQTLLFSDSNPVLFPEIFDPATKSFSKLRAHMIPRNYHSTAILMPDATVFSGGGGLCNGCSANHFDGQMFSPPYLFEADGITLAKRPSISSVNGAGNVAKVPLGGSLDIQMEGAGSYSFSLIRMGSSTHAVNTDQRRIPLQATGSENRYQASIPKDAGVALPGYWMLFAVDGNGVPSVAKTVHIALP
ncbi:uncharacterized protein RHO25_010348 [Cercospora beticola]|uniref:WSC domain-containing protein n=2 Tax=Cercospora beticola TaxID=122368 RepID=A0ABZ0P1G8_CERBT|nr:hypothetical protein RHO25_010348 [Cercospora beticola]